MLYCTVTRRVVNANLRVLDDNARGQVGAISLSTQALGGGLEQLCDAVAAPGLDSISALVDRILKVTGAGAASDLVENAKAIQTSIATISTRAGSIDSVSPHGRRRPLERGRREREGTNGKCHGDGIREGRGACPLALVQRPV